MGPLTETPAGLRQGQTLSVFLDWIKKGDNNLPDIFHTSDEVLEEAWGEFLALHK